MLEQEVVGLISRLNVWFHGLCDCLFLAQLRSAVPSAHCCCRIRQTYRWTVCSSVRLSVTLV